MHIDPQLNGRDCATAFTARPGLFFGLWFGSLSVVSIHWGSGVVDFPAPDHPMLSFGDPFEILLFGTDHFMLLKFALLDDPLKRIR